MSSSGADKENSAAVAPDPAGSAKPAAAKSNSKPIPYEAHNYVGPYRLEKTLGKGQTGKTLFFSSSGINGFDEASC